MDDYTTGASYLVRRKNNDVDASRKFTNIACIRFQQNGTIPDNGVNGVTNEAMLSVLIHRTKILNEKLPCDENEAAITLMEEALFLFEERTQKRKEKGVEGRYEK